MNGSSLRVVVLKPGKYGADGYVQRFRSGFMPNSTVLYLASLTPETVDGARCEVVTVDEYVHTDLDYLDLLSRDPNRRTLVALAGVQSHQFQRALDLAALARSRGVEGVVIGGPHPMTCDTSELHGRGVSFALSEAEGVWPAILRDALAGELQPVYGGDTRWQAQLDPPPLIPHSRRDLRRYAVRMLGIYPARGCPYTCNFCSVIKIAGRQVRSQPVATTIASLKAAKAVGVRIIMFTADNFNKYPEVRQLLEAMIQERIRLPFFAQCDTQIARQEDLVELLARAGCFQMFVGVESFHRDALRGAICSAMTWCRCRKASRSARATRSSTAEPSCPSTKGLPGLRRQQVRVSPHPPAPSPGPPKSPDPGEGETCFGCAGGLEGVWKGGLLG